MNTFYLQHRHGTLGPFRTESVEAVERGGPQAKRGTVTATRFMVRWYGRLYRVYSDHAMACRGMPHFIKYDGERVAVDGVSP